MTNYMPPYHCFCADCTFQGDAIAFLNHIRDVQVVDVGLEKILVHVSDFATINGGNHVLFGDGGLYVEQPQDPLGTNSSIVGQSIFDCSSHDNLGVTGYAHKHPSNPSSDAALNPQSPQTGCNDISVPGHPSSGSYGNDETSIEVSQDSEANLKLKPYACTEQGCMKSFTRNADRKRHMEEVHRPPTLYCLESGCRLRHPKGFHRFEKLIDHQKNKHDLGKRHVRWGYGQVYYSLGSDLERHKLCTLVEMPVAVDKIFPEIRYIISEDIFSADHCYKCEVRSDGTLRLAVKSYDFGTRAYGDWSDLLVVVDKPLRE